MPQRKVGIIGQLATAIDTGAVKNASLVSLFDVVPANIEALKKKLGSKPGVFTDFEKFVKTHCDIIIEAA